MNRRDFVSLIAGGAASTRRGAAAEAPRSLGKLDAFWRYSPVLGPFLEAGQGIEEIPDYMLAGGDFPYKKRPYPKEVLFADHLSVVRLLGGYNDGSASGKPDPSVRDRDLAYRDADGKIRYRMHLLKPRLQPYLENGYTSLTLVLDNVPWCFPEKPAAVGLGQYAPPHDPGEWRDFIREVCRELVNIMGADAARQLRFRVGTENNGTTRFSGTHEQYVRHYDFTCAAILEVLPGARVGPYNISGVSLRGISLQNVNAFALAEHCFREPNLASGKRPTPFDFIAFSRYYKPGDDPELHARTCREVWNEFDRRAPQLKRVPREIHEFGVAPFGEVSKGEFPSAEPGALGAALTHQMMFRLRAAGLDHAWHWGLMDRFRGRKGDLLFLPIGQAWLLMVLEHMAGGDAYILQPVGQVHDLPAVAGRGPAPLTQYLATASFTKDRAFFLISAYSRNLSNHTAETVGFRLPPGMRASGKPARFVRLSRDTSIYDVMRRQFAGKDLLAADFVSRPDRLGTVRQMGKGREAEHFAGDHWQEYTRQWADSLRLQPLPDSAGKIESGSITVRLAPPEVLAVAVFPV